MLLVSTPDGECPIADGKISIKGDGDLFVVVFEDGDGREITRIALTPPKAASLSDAIVRATARLKEFRSRN